MLILLLVSQLAAATAGQPPEHPGITWTGPRLAPEEAARILANARGASNWTQIMAAADLGTPIIPGPSAQEPQYAPAPDTQGAAYGNDGLPWWPWGYYGAGWPYRSRFGSRAGFASRRFDGQRVAAQPLRAPRVIVPGRTGSGPNRGAAPARAAVGHR